MIKRPKTGQQVCKDCFFFAFEEEIHKTITDAGTFKRGERVAIGASGGKGECLFTLLAITNKICPRFNRFSTCYENTQR